MMRKLAAKTILTLAVLFYSWPALAETPKFIVDPADKTLVIQGVLDEKNTAFKGNVRLTLQGADAKEVCLLASDLKHETEPSAGIDRSQVTIPTGTSLANGRPRDVPVTVSNVPRPGAYSGELKFYLPDQPEANPLTVSLKLNMDAKPDVVSLTPDVTIQVVRDGNWADRILAGWLLPDSMTRDMWAVHLDNRTLAPVEIADAGVVLRGEKSAVSPGPGAIDLKTPKPLAPSGVASTELALSRQQLAPDRYKGNLRFRFRGNDTPLGISLVLEVRSGPLVPLLIILLGILMGRLVRDSESPAAKIQAKLYPGFYHAKAAIQSITNPRSFEFMEKQLASFKARLDKGKDTEEALTLELDRIGEQTMFFRSLEELEKQFSEKSEQLADDLREKMEETRNAVMANDLKKAEEHRREIEERMKNTSRDGTLRGGGMAMEITGLMRNLAARIRVPSEKEGREVPEQPVGKRMAWLARVPSVLAGSKTVSAEIRFWLIRPLLYLLLLAVLTLLGLQTLYVNADATFGASGIYDYLGLFLWGLSADIAQRTLQNVGTPG